MKPLPPGTQAGEPSLLDAFGLDLIEHSRLAMIARERHRSLERDEATELAHVNAVAVGIHDGRAGAGNNHGLGIQPREHGDDRLAQRGAAHD